MADARGDGRRRPRSSPRCWSAARAPAAARATRIVCPSRAAADQIADVFAFPRDAVDAVPHGVSPTFAVAAPAERGRPYVLFASQLHPRKNLAALREALRINGGPDLVVVGGAGPGSPGLERSRHRRPRADRRCRRARRRRPRRPRARRADGRLRRLLPAVAVGGLRPDRARGDGGRRGRRRLRPRRAARGRRRRRHRRRPRARPARRAASRRALEDPEPLRRAARARAAEFTWERTARGWFEALERTVR